jgi:two-component system phosphate regulon sensor histidine kinase PhoR
VQVGSRELWLSFLGVRIRDGVVYTFRDTTAERQLEESKHEFIATVSHELRTPMTGVLGAAHTLLREDLDLSPEAARELLEMIAAQAQRLSDVTDGLLLADRLERDEVAVEARHVDVDQIVRDTIAALAPTLPPSLRVEHAPGPAPPAVGDTARLQQVLINLVENAARYSPDGGTISVRTSGDGDRVRIEVADEGVGIPPADRERIFEKFFRSESSRRFAPGGSGLGLYICRGLLERMGGRIGVSSEPGAGSTFTVSLTAAPRSGK